MIVQLNESIGKTVQIINYDSSLQISRGPILLRH